MTPGHRDIADCEEAGVEILILGGTAMLGRALVRDAVQRGHAVTCLARGSENPTGSAGVPDGATFVRGDRDAAGAYDAVRGPWDAVIDVSRQPGQVRSAVALVDAAHWVFVSSVNVYAGLEAGRAEDAPLLPPLEGDSAGPHEYGPGKVACERAVLDGIESGRMRSATLARLGLLGGAEDDTGRSGYWPWRFAHPSGPDVIVPDDASFPVALLDVEDAAAWLVDAAEQRFDGAFNVANEATTLGEVLALAADVAGSATPEHPVTPALLAELGANPWMGPCSLPLWIDDPDWRGFPSVDTTRARSAGLATRPIRDTLAAALAYEESRGGPVGAGLSDDDEERIRRASAANKGQEPV